MSDPSPEAQRYGSTPAVRDANARLGRVLQFMRLLWAVSHGLDAVSKRMSRELGVTGPQRLVIRLVGCFPGISAGDLAALMHSHPSTLTGVLRRLEARRLLVRANDPFDARRLLFRLTSRGRRIDRLRAGTVEASVAATLSGAAASDVLAASHLLRRLAARLASETSSPPAQVRARRSVPR